VIQGSTAGGAYQAFAFQNAINGAWINSGVVDIAYLNSTELNAAYLTTALQTGNTGSAATAASDVKTAATGSGVCTDSSGTGTLTTIGCPAGAGAANTALSNVGSVTAFSSNLQFAGGFGTITTTSNGPLSLLPNGTGSVVVPQGTASNPALEFTGDTAGNGLYLSGVGSIVYEVGSTASFQIANSAGYKAKASLCYGWSSTTSAVGAYDTAFSRVAANTAGLGTTCGAVNATFELGTLTLEGSTSGSFPLSATSTGGTLNLGANATITTAGLGTFASLAAVGAIKSGVNNIAYSTTPVLNMALGNIQQFSCTTAGAAISPTTSGLAAGQVMTLIFVQNGTTACTLTYPATMHGGTTVGTSLSGVNVQSFVVSNNASDLYATSAMATNSTGGTP
jgi:hypothetical protein